MHKVLQQDSTGATVYRVAQEGEIKFVVPRLSNHKLMY
jgi:hypothetical protein